MLRALSDADVLALWERGAAWHPLDRALLLCAAARSDLAPSELPDLPLGAVNAALLRLRRASFGERIETWLDCERCSERLEIEIDASALLGEVSEPDPQAELALSGHCFRPLRSRDLAAVADAADPRDAALRLLERCCAEQLTEDERERDALLAAVDIGLEALDPMADIRLAVSCHACGHAWDVSLDVAALLWDELSGRAYALLGEVHRLASAYGWSEHEILALGPARRAAYLARVPA